MTEHTADPPHTTAGDGYDIFSEDYCQDPYAHWRDMRQGCPVAHSDKWGGSWMLTRYEDIRNAAREGVRLSSKATEAAGPLESAGGLFMPPLTSDPPDHKPHRDLLMPFFTPAKVAEFEPYIRSRSRELAEQLAERGHGDAVGDFAQHVTLGVLTEMLGVPDSERIVDWMVRMVRIGPRDQPVRSEAIREILDYVDGLLTERESSDDESDLLTYLAHAEIDGAPLPRKHKLGAAFLVLLAGADTTWSAIGASLWHLATFPDDRRRLLAEPDVWTTAIEEFLRAYAPVTIGRLVQEDLELHGRCIAAPARMLLPFGAANRDPEHFEDPDEVQLDRKTNPHITFGVGAHRCLGRGLARTELRIALEEWLRAMPDFHLTAPDDVEWTGGTTRGPEHLDFAVGA